MTKPKIFTLLFRDCPLDAFSFIFHLCDTNTTSKREKSSFPSRPRHHHSRVTFIIINFGSLCTEKNYFSSHMPRKKHQRWIFGWIMNCCHWRCHFLLLFAIFCCVLFFYDMKHSLKGSSSSIKRHTFTLQFGSFSAIWYDMRVSERRFCII